MAETTSSRQLVLEELRKAYEQKFSANDSLDNKLQNILTFVSVVVTVAPSLEVLVAPNPRDMSILFVLLLLVVLAFYIYVFYVIQAGLSPVDYKQPMSGDWDELWMRYIYVEAEQAIELTINEYLTSMAVADEHNKSKIRAVVQATGLMAVIVVLLLFATPVNMFLTHPTVSEVLKMLSH